MMRSARFIYKLATFIAWLRVVSEGRSNPNNIFIMMKYQQRFYRLADMTLELPRTRLPRTLLKVCFLALSRVVGVFENADSMQPVIRRFLCFVICGSMCFGQQNASSFQYFYDDSGQLFRVLDSKGNLIEYDYDAVGNILQIQRSTIAANSLAIFNVTPLKGAAGSALTN